MGKKVKEQTKYEKFLKRSGIPREVMSGLGEQADAVRNAAGRMRGDAEENEAEAELMTGALMAPKHAKDTAEDIAGLLKEKRISAKALEKYGVANQVMDADDILSSDPAETQQQNPGNSAGPGPGSGSVQANPPAEAIKNVAAREAALEDLAREMESAGVQLPADMKAEMESAGVQLPADMKQSGSQISADMRSEMEKYGVNGFSEEHSHSDPGGDQHSGSANRPDPQAAKKQAAMEKARRQKKRDAAKRRRARSNARKTMVIQEMLHSEMNGGEGNGSSGAAALFAKSLRMDLSNLLSALGRKVGKFLLPILGVLLAFVLFFVLLVCSVTAIASVMTHPISYFAGVYSDSEITGNPAYINTVLDQKYTEFHGAIDAFAEANEHNTVKYREGSKVGNYHDVAAVYLSIMYEGQFGDDAQEYMEDYLVIDTPQEQEVFDRVFAQMNTTMVEDRTKTVTYTEEQKVTDRSTVAKNIVVMYPASAVGGKDMTKQYLYDYQNDRYLKDGKGAYLRMDLLASQGYEVIKERSNVPLFFQSGKFHIVDLYRVDKVTTRTVQVERTEEIAYQDMTVSMLSASDWRSQYGSVYSANVLSCLDDLAEYTDSASIGGIDYTVSEEALKDEAFRAILTEAEKYLGYPYVWGGSNPSTSFDCSGYVCWVLNHSGVTTVAGGGRTDCNGLMAECATFTSRADAKPGDLVFFQKTYEKAGATHVGIYVGDSMMIHCGSPIQYASIDSNYWQSHFLCFGRIQWANH